MYLVRVDQHGRLAKVHGPFGNETEAEQWVYGALYCKYPKLSKCPSLRYRWLGHNEEGGWLSVAIIQPTLKV